jgi:hypothetical protein
MQDNTLDYSLPTSQIVGNLPPLITIRQAEETGAASARTLRRMCTKGDLRATKAGADWRIARDPFLRRFGLID